MKKILALVMAMALLVCSAAVFTVSAAEVTFDELVAAEKEYNKASVGSFYTNNTHWQDTGYGGNKTGWGMEINANDDGTAHVYVGAHSDTEFGYIYNSAVAVDGAHIVLGNLSFAAGNEKMISLFFVNPQTNNTLEAFVRIHEDGEVVVRKNGWQGTLQAEGADSTGVLAGIFAQGAVSIFSLSLDANNNIVVTVTNAAGSVALPALTQYSTEGVSRETMKLAVGNGYVGGIDCEFDILAIHGGNGLCGVEAAQWFDNVTESDSDVHEADLSEWDVFTDYWADNGRAWVTAAANGGINVKTLSHPQLTLGVQTKSMVKLNGAHIVLDNISANTPSLWMAFGTYTAEDANVGFGVNSPLVSFDFNTNSITNIVVGGATLLEGSAVVAGMKSGKTVLSFEVKDNEVYMTLTNTAGTATVKFSLYGSVWTERSEAYISFCHRHDGGADSYTTYDIVAFHDGAEECGLTLKAKKEAGDKMVASLAAATSGATVKLTANATADSVVVKPGVTLDLNGYTLEADYAASFGDVVNGTLKVAKDNIMLSEDNAALPVWNGSAYVFVAAPTFQDQSVTNGSNVKYTFLPTFDADVHDLLAAGAAASDVTVTVRLTWTAKEGGKATQRFVYSDEFVQTVVNSYNGEKYNSAFTLLFNNAASLSGLTYEVEVVSGTGVVFAPSKTVA